MIETDKIITYVEKAIKYAKQKLEKVKREKEERVKSVLSMLLQEIKPSEKFLALSPEKAFKTLRKLPLYG